MLAEHCAHIEVNKKVVAEWMDGHAHLEWVYPTVGVGARGRPARLSRALAARVLVAWAGPRAAPRSAVCATAGACLVY